MNGNINILHLTDLHFTDDTSKERKFKRELVLDNLLEELEQNIDLLPQIDYIAISGDISFRGAASGYVLATDFLKKLSKIIFKNGDYKERIIVCPGNHDVNRKKISTFYWRDNKKKFGNDPHAVVSTEFMDEKMLKSLTTDADAFDHYNSFCEQLSAATIEVPATYAGCKTFGINVDHSNKTCFVVLNSCFYSGVGLAEDPDSASKDDKRLVLGEPLLSSIFDGDEIKSKCGDLNDYTVVVLVHHPPSWYAWGEIFNNESSDYDPPLNNINKYADIVLTGHEHGELKDPHNYGGKALWFAGGASYSEGGSKFYYRNNFSILRVEKSHGLVHRQDIDYLPNKKKWHISKEEKSYLLGDARDKIVKLCSDKRQSVLQYFEEKAPPQETKPDFSALATQYEEVVKFIFGDKIELEKTSCSFTYKISDRDSYISLLYISQNTENVIVNQISESSIISSLATLSLNHDSQHESHNIVLFGFTEEITAPEFWERARRLQNKLKDDHESLFVHGYLRCLPHIFSGELLLNKN